MKKDFLKIIFLSLIIFPLFFNKAIASNTYLRPSKDSVGLNEQFYVDLFVNPQDKSINTISGTISLSNNNLDLLRIEDGKSIINLWIKKPKSDNNVIDFAGLITNGFDGVVNPFDNNKLDGNILRLVFESKTPGTTEFDLSSVKINLNDGLGTEISIPSSRNNIIIEDFNNDVNYKNTDKESPELYAYITRNENLFDNNYVLIFDAKDSSSGIKEVLVKEGSGDWVEANSPYLLSNQNLTKEVSIKAVNFSGQNTIKNIYPNNNNSLLTISIIATIFVILALLIKFIFKA